MAVGAAGYERDEVLTGWGRTAPTRATVWRPPNAAAIASRFAEFERDGRGTIARGLARSYGDAAQNAGGHVIAATAIDRVHAFDTRAGTVTCDAGASLDLLMRLVIPHGWFPMVVPGTRSITVGGGIASDVHGKYRHGSFADSLFRAHLATPVGEFEIAPDQETDLFWATAGGMGLTGFVTDATLRLHPIETAWMSVDTDRCADLDECMAKMKDVDRYRYSVAWIDCMTKGKHLGRSILERGNHAPLAQLDFARAKEPLAYAPDRMIPTPPWLPNGLMNPLSMRAFCELWYRKAPKRSRDHLHSISGFFHPLDGIDGWPVVYGSRGFLQYQFVVPDGAEAVVRHVIEGLANAGCPSFVSVLKRFEHGNAGHLSFPMAGWTLTLDIPTAVGGLGELLDGFDRRVIEAGGRVYLAKDSRLSAESFAQMYPRLDEWRAIQRRVDPDGVMQSDLSRRLHLTVAPTKTKPAKKTTTKRTKARRDA